MNDITTELASATSSLQSSIIKPRYRNEDVKFTTVNMFEDDDIFQQLTSSLKYALPGSNRSLFVHSNYYESLYYTFLRYILSFLFSVYQYYIWLTNEATESFFIINASIWNLFTIFSFSNDSVVDMKLFTQNSSNSHSQKSSIALKNISFQPFNQLRELPTRISNKILEKSLSASVPRNRLQIRQRLGRLYIPTHIAFLFEMNALIVPQPPEVPIPYLDFDKRIIVPNEKDVATVLAQRAEWTSLNHTHKISETFRVIYESAKCITWAACSGVKIVTIFESNGYAWKDMPLLASLIREEMKSLTPQSYQVSDSIKLINLDNDEIIKISENYNDVKPVYPHPKQSFQQNNISLTSIYENKNEVSELDPIPESSVDESFEIESLDLENNDMNNIFCTNLCVFFMSNKTSNAKQFRALRIKKLILEKLNSTDSFLSSDGIFHYPINPNYIENYTDPEIVLKFCTSSQTPYSLCGYPLMTTNFALPFASSSFTPIILSDQHPANFPFFMRGLVKFNKMFNQKAKFEESI